VLNLQRDHSLTVVVILREPYTTTGVDDVSCGHLRARARPSGFDQLEET